MQFFIAESPSSPLPGILKKLQGQRQKISKLNIPNNLDGNETSPEFKNNQDIWYSDTPHIYFKRSTFTPIISTTTLIGSLSDPFDTEGQSFKCACKPVYECENLDTKNWEVISTLDRAVLIKNAWKTTNVQGTTYGSMGHTVFEHGAKHRELTFEQMYMFAQSKYNLDHPILKNFAEDLFTNYFPKFGMFEVLSEPLLQLGELLAGQADLVLLDHTNKVVHVLDYKTNKHKPGSIEDKSYGNFKFIVPRLRKNSLSEYQLQLCLYQQMLLAQYPGYIAGSNFILWGNRDTGLMETIEINPGDHYNDICLIWQFLVNNSEQLRNIN